MFKKIKMVLLIILSLVCIVITKVIIDKKNEIKKQNTDDIFISEKYYDEENNYEKLKTIYVEDYLRGNEGSFEFGYILAKKNGNWERFPLSEKFKAKYNEKKGILGELEYDNIEYRPYAYSNEDYYFKDYYTYFVITQGMEKTAYIYDTEYQEQGYLLNDVKIEEVIKVTDKYGNKLKVESHNINNQNFAHSFYMLSYGGNDEKSVAATSNFHSKYPFFLDIFEHYSPLKYNHIKFIEEKSSWEKKEAYFEVDSVLECKKRNYLVEFALDDKGYLDDVVVHKVNEWEYDGNRDNFVEKITYRNSNWSKLELTDGFKKKYNSVNGIIKDIDDIDINIPMDGITIERSHKYIMEFNDKNGNRIFYIYEYFEDSNGNLNDILCEKLPYTNKTAEEVKELYLKDHNK